MSTPRPLARTAPAEALGLFRVQEDAQAITRTRGVFKQTKVYSRGRQFYAQHGSGYVRLCGQGRTSHPDVICVEIVDPQGIVPANLGSTQ